MRGTKEFYLDAKGEWRWRIKAANGRIVADSGEGYERLRDAKHGMRVMLFILLFGKTKNLEIFG